MRQARWVAPALAACALFAARGAAAEPAKSTLRVGSKRFTESYILAEIAVLVAASGADAEVEHVEGLGGTAIVHRALEEGSIDLYPEYTGTIVEAILHRQDRPSLDEIRRALAEKGLGVSAPLGFENTYAIAVPNALAERDGLTRISDLAKASALRAGFSHEFLGRSDGWPGLSARYGLSAMKVEGLDHGLALEAIRKGAIDVTDVYSTDAKIARFDLKVLDDDRHFFPGYEAVFLYREDAKKRAPRAFAALACLTGRLSAASMIALNGRVELDGMTAAAAAGKFVRTVLANDEGMKCLAPIAAPERASEAPRGLFREVIATVRREGPRHLGLVALSVALATLIGVPLGVIASRSRHLGRLLLACTGLVQTIPSLALLCFLIPWLGTGPLPALVALFLYGLLPIARNTAAGIGQIAPPLIESAEALGLSRRDRLSSIELPLAAPTILAGVRTSAVINVGTATLAAFIGAGGFGAPISIGLNLNDTRLILAGAIPAAGLALLVEALFTAIERFVVPRGLRLDGAASEARRAVSPRRAR